MKYVFRTTATMKEYNCEKYWISSDIIKDFSTVASTLAEAFSEYRKFVSGCYVDISKSAIKNKAPMFRDTHSSGPKQCGYVLTASTDFEVDPCKENGWKHRWSKQFIDLWVEIFTQHEIDFESAV